MLTPRNVHSLVNQFLRDGGPSIHVVYCDTKNFVLGVRRLSADLISDKDAFSREVFANLPFAPTNFFLDIPPVDRARSSEETIRAAVDAVRKVADDARLMRIYLIDAIMTDGTGFYSMHRSHREAMTIFELPRASVTASAGNAAGEANEDDRSEIQRQEADVIARFTNPDGTKKESWMKYEDGTPITGLTERQFVQVQTPNFKRYFGDWQSLIIRNMLDQTPAPVIQEGAFKKIEGESVWDAASRLLKNHVTHKTRIGNVIIDSRSAQDSLNQGKNQAKLDALVSIQCDFKNAVYITSTPHRKKKKTMEHYFAYPVMYNGEREIVFCSVEEDINKNRLYLHDVVIERDLIDESNTHTTGARGNSSRHDGGVAHSRSILLSLYRVNTNDVSKIVDRHGWPLKVYHGATEEFWSFDKTKQRMNRSGDAFWATTSMAVARTYAGSSGVIREGFVNVRNAKRINANNAPHFKVKAGAHTGTSRIVGRTNRKHFDGVIFDKVKDVNAFNMNLSPATSIAFFEPNQFKSATDNTGAFDPAEYDIRLSITAYHGTPHDFERFDHSFMGSGEGAQAYGWGTYLSAVEGVARGYAERLWGKAIRKANKSGIMVKLLRDKHVINEIIPFQERQLKDLCQRRESFAKRGVVNNHTEQKIQELEDSISSMKKRLQEINEAVANIPKPYKRNLLTVEIPDDSGTNYIHWNAPLTQSQIDVLRASGEIDDDADLHSGGALYEYLTEKLCGQQEASLFLSSLGFTGIKVPVNNTHGGNANGDMNYVIFKEDDIKVVDHERWSIVGKKGIENIAGAHQARAALETARAMENVGIDSKKIFLATGWERGKDLLWRYELPDPKLKPEIAEKFSRYEKVSVVFEDAFDAPELFEAYPQLRRWLLESDNIPTSIYAGVMLESFDTIRINRALRRNPKEALSTIVHEVQHIIQGIEGFHKGSSVELMEERIKNVEHAYNVRSNALKEFTDRPDFIAKLDELMPWDKPDVDFDAGEKAFKQWLREQPWYDRYEYALERVAQVEDVLRDIRKADYSPETMYHRNSGETEARNASARMALSPEQRRTMAFSETEDVDRADQIIIALSQEAEAAADNDYNEEAAKSTSEAGGINDHIPTDGWYQFKTNTNADGNQKWIITGALRIGRALTREEGDAICDELGIAHDAPYETPAEEKPRASVTATAGNAAGEANDDTLNLYFKPDPAATAIPIASLHTLKDEPQKSINNARRFMDMSARGENDPRKPIAVADNGDGTYTVVDGNATTWAASQMGLTHVRAIVVGKNEGTRLRNSGLLVKNETPAEEQDADGKLHTRGLDGLSGEAAREKAYEQAEENIQTLSDITNEAAGIVGGTVLIRPVNKAGNNVDPREVGKAIKKRDRVNKKVASDYADDYSRCVDLIGTTLVMPDNGDYTDAVKKLRKAAEARGCTIAKVKKLNLVPNAQGYRDIKVSIRFPNGGIGEVIVVEEYINDAKFNRGGHEIYEAERMVEPIKDESDSANEAYRLLKALNEAVYGRGESAMPADAFERAKASASASLTRLLGEQNLSLSSEDTTELKSLSSKLQSAQPASVDSYAMPSLSFIQNDISQSPSAGSMDQTMQEVNPPQDPPSVADAMTKQEAKEFRTSITWDTSKREFSSMGYLTGYAVSREITGNPATDDELSRLAQALGVAADIKELKKSAKRYLKDAKPLSQSMPVAELIRTIASKRDDDRISDIVTSLYENAFAEGEDVGWRAARAWDKAVHLANLAAETYTREMMAAETGVDPVALLVELIPEAFDTRMEWKEQNAEDSGKSDGTDLERPDLPFDEAEARARALTAKMRENYSRVLHRAREIAAEMKRQRDAENEAAHQRFLDEQREKEAAKERFLDKLDDNGGLDETDDEKEARAAKEEANRLQQDINTAAMIMALKECGKFVDLTTDLEFAAFLQAWVTDYIVQRNDINPEDVFKHPQHVATYRNTVKHVLAELADAMLDPSEDKAAVKVARQIGEIIAEWGPEEIAMASANIFADIQAAAVKQTRARLIRDAIAMVKDKTQYGNRLSPQDQEFVRLCLYEKKPIVDAYIAAYSPNTENRDKIKYYAERKLKRLSWALREETAFGDNRPMQEAFGNAGVSETVTKNKNHYLEVYGRYLARVLKMTTKDIEEEREKYQSIADQRERAYADASEQAKATGHAAVEAIDDVAIQDALMRLNILSTYGGLRDRKPSEIEAAFLSMQEFLDKKIAEHFEKWATIRQQWDSVATLLHDALEASTPSGITPPDSILANFSDAFFSVGQKLHLAAAAATPEQRRAVEYVVNLIAKGSEQYQVLMYQSRKDWNTAMEKACEGTGTKTSGLLQLLDEIVPEDLNAALITDDQRCTMTWSQVMQLYSSLLQTETYSNNILQHNRFEQIELIENAAPPVLIRFVAELRDIYARRRPELSRAVEAVTGLPVYSPDPLYMPAKMFIRRTEGLTTEVYGWSPLGKALTPRIKNGLDFDLSANLSSMYLDRAEVNARAIAFGMRGLALRSILTRSQNRLAMEHAVGTHAANSFVNHVSEVLTGNDTRRESNRAFTKIIATAVNWASLFTLSYNHSSPLRQMASVPVTSGLLKGGMWELAKNMFSFDLEAARALIHSPGFIARYGAEGIKDMFVDAIMDPSAGKIKRFYKFGMSGMKLGDIGACLIPGAGIYKARLAEILAENQGIDTEKAKEQAASETWAILDKTQQASRVENMPGILTKFGDTGKLFSQFTTSQIQQVGMEMFQFRMWRRARKLGNKQAAEEYGRKLRNTLIVNRLVMPALMHLVDTLLLALAAGEPPEKEELIVDAAMSLLLGPFGELFFISGIVSQFSGTASKALGAKSRMQFRQDSIPSLAVIQKLFNKGVLTTFDLITCDFDQALEDAIDLTGTVFAPIRFIDRRRTNLEMKKD